MARPDGHGPNESYFGYGSDDARPVVESPSCGATPSSSRAEEAVRAGWVCAGGAAGRGASRGVLETAVDVTVVVTVALSLGW